MPADDPKPGSRPARSSTVLDEWFGIKPRALLATFGEVLVAPSKVAGRIIERNWDGVVTPKVYFATSMSMLLLAGWLAAGAGDKFLSQNASSDPMVWKLLAVTLIPFLLAQALLMRGFARREQRDSLGVSLEDGFIVTVIRFSSFLFAGSFTQLFLWLAGAEDFEGTRFPFDVLISIPAILSFWTFLVSGTVILASIHGRSIGYTVFVTIISLVIALVGFTIGFGGQPSAVGT